MRSLCAWSLAFLVWMSTSGPVLAQGDPFVPWIKITASDAAAGDEFGAGFPTGVAISADGSTALVSAHLADCAAGADCGTAYVFVRDRGTWVQQVKLPLPSAPGDRVEDVALSADGDTALVGAEKADCAAGADCGAAYIFVRTGTTWSLQQKIAGADTTAGDFFGLAVALSADGTTALVGAYQVRCGAFSSCGAAYVFTRSGEVWTQEQKLTGEASPNNYFGGTVALSANGDTALVAGDRQGGAFHGEVYVFTRSGGAWSLQTKLSPSNSPSVLAFGFAAALSADGNIALIHGASFGQIGAAYVFVRSGATWSEEDIFSSTDAAFLDRFSEHLALSGDGETALVGAIWHDCAAGPRCGAAYVFRRNGGDWTQVQKLTAADAVADHQFGVVALSGDARTALAGAPGAPCAAGANCGAGYLFTNAPLAVGIPTLGATGLSLLTLFLVAGALLLLQRRRSL
ncbi:MAG TPA: hypothetical protein VLB76_09265 [Thermoanaerobaculia bacterium]|jgi:hypothetical protein|nr:hypothetical protein [Thermoanaerobaculia bacterium]